MALDPSISLQTFQPPPLSQTIGSLLNIQRTQQAIQGQNIANQSAGIKLSNLTNLNNLANDPDVQNPDGTINQEALLQKAQKVGGVDGAGYATNSANAATANTQQAAASYHFNKQQGQDAQAAIGGVVNDPRMMSGDPEKVADALSEAEDNMTTAGVPKGKAKLAMSQFYAMAKTDPGNVRNAIRNLTLGQTGAPNQYNAGSPAVSLVPSADGTQPTNVAPNLPGLAVGAPMGAAIKPPNQLVQTPQGASVVGNVASGQVSPFTSAPAPAGGASTAMGIPAGETTATGAAYQQQRQDTLTSLRNAPNLLNLNQGIRDIASKGLPLGSGGGKLQALASTFGYQLSGDDATDRNTLAKLLANQTLASAQALPSNPSTNAGLAEVQAANGTTATDAKTLTRIADRSTALINGTQGYAAGLNAAMARAQATNPNVDPIYAKPAYDQAWSANFDPDMTLYAAAKKRGDTAVMNSIIASHGGKGSQGAIDFSTRANAVNNLQRFGTLQGQ